MNNRNFLIIFNPASGKHNPAFKLYQFKDFLDKQGAQYFIYHTRPGKKDIEDIKSFYTSGFTDIIVIGGDGTLNLVINAIIDDPLPIGILPTGTGNDFMKNLNIGQSFQQQMNAAVNGKLRRVDVGMCNDYYFLNGIGVGYDGLVAHKLHRKKKKLKGHLAYLAIVLSSFLFYKETAVSFKINDQNFQIPIFMLTIGNGTTFGGGFKITPQAIVDDELLNVCVVSKISAWRRILNINKLRMGQHQNVKEISFHQCKVINIYDSDVPAHMDGEPIDSTSYQISISTKKVSIRE